MNDEIRKALKRVINVELLELDSFRLTVGFTPMEACLVCRFNGYVLSFKNLQPQKFGLDFHASLHSTDPIETVAETEFTVGYNPETEKMQLLWHEQPPENIHLFKGIDVVFGCVGAILSTNPMAKEVLSRVFPQAEPANAN